MSELHIIGQILYAKKFSNKNLYCKWHLQMGKNWQVISGETSGQTQVDSSIFDNLSNWSYPIDIHLSTTGIDGWPKIYIEVYYLDFFGRSNLNGVGFICIPTTPGKHTLDSYTWRPYENLSTRICKYFCINGNQLTNPEFICNQVDRFSLQTESEGIVRFQLDIIMKYFDKYAIEYK